MIDKADFSPEELAHVLSLTVELVKIRQSKCEHLCLENIAPDLYHELLTRLALAKSGACRIGDSQE